MKDIIVKFLDILPNVIFWLLMILIFVPKELNNLIRSLSIGVSRFFSINIFKKCNCQTKEETTEGKNKDT